MYKDRRPSDYDFLLGAVFVVCVFVGVALFGSESSRQTAASRVAMVAAEAITTTPASPAPSTSVSQKPATSQKECMQKIPNTSGYAGEEYACIDNCIYYVRGQKVQPVFTPNTKPGKIVYTDLFGGKHNGVCTDKGLANSLGKIDNAYVSLQYQSTSAFTEVNNLAPTSGTTGGSTVLNGVTQTSGGTSLQETIAKSGNMSYSPYYKEGDVAGNFGDLTKWYETDATALAGGSSGAGDVAKLTPAQVDAKINNIQPVVQHEYGNIAGSFEREAQYAKMTDWGGLEQAPNIYDGAHDAACAENPGACIGGPTRGSIGAGAPVTYSPAYPAIEGSARPALSGPSAAALPPPSSTGALPPPASSASVNATGPVLEATQGRNGTWTVTSTPSPATIFRWTPAGAFLGTLFSSNTVAAGTCPAGPNTCSPW